MTVGELKQALSALPDDVIVVARNSSGAYDEISRAPNISTLTKKTIPWYDFMSQTMRSKASYIHDPKGQKAVIL